MQDIARNIAINNGILRIQFDMTFDSVLTPKQLYMKVVDADGVPVGSVSNITQNGKGFFEIFGVELSQDVAQRVLGLNSMNGHIFLNVDMIDTVDEMIKLKKRLVDLKEHRDL